MQLELVIDRLEEEKAVLMDQEQNIFVWPKKRLPAGAHEGQIILVEIKDAAEREAEVRAEAKDILNEVLNLEV